MTVPWFHPYGRYSRHLTKQTMNAAHVAPLYDDTQKPVFVVSGAVETPQARRFQDHHSPISYSQSWTSSIGRASSPKAPAWAWVAMHRLTGISAVYYLPPMHAPRLHKLAHASAARKRYRGLKVSRHTGLVSLAPRRQASNSNHDISAVRLMKTRDAGHCFEAVDKLCQSPADQLEKSTIEARDTRCRAMICGTRCNYYEEIGYPLKVGCSHNRVR